MVIIFLLEIQYPSLISLSMVLPFHLVLLLETFASFLFKNYLLTLCINVNVSLFYIQSISKIENFLSQSDTDMYLLYIDLTNVMPFYWVSKYLV